MLYRLFKHGRKANLCMDPAAVKGLKVLYLGHEMASGAAGLQALPAN